MRRCARASTIVSVLKVAGEGKPANTLADRSARPRRCRDCSASCCAPRAITTPRSIPAIERSDAGDARSGQHCASPCSIAATPGQALSPSMRSRRCPASILPARHDGGDMRRTRSAIRAGRSGATRIKRERRRRRSLKREARRARLSSSPRSPSRTSTVDHDRHVPQRLVARASIPSGEKRFGKIVPCCRHPKLFGAAATSSASPASTPAIASTRAEAGRSAPRTHQHRAGLDRAAHADRAPPIRPSSISTSISSPRRRARSPRPSATPPARG